MITSACFQVGRETCNRRQTDSEREANSRVTNANQSFAMLKNIWKSKQVGTNTTLRIFNSNVLSVLLYGAECWKLTTRIAHKIHTFQNKCLRKILRIFWPRRISNEELHQRTKAKSLTQTVKKDRWRWQRHVCRMPQDALPRIALCWTPDGKRKRGCPKETWQRTMEKEMKACRLTWETITRQAANRQQWHSLVEALSAT